MLHVDRDTTVLSYVDICVCVCVCVEVRELTEQLADVQCSFDKCSREKTSLTAELQATRSQLNSVDVDYGKVIKRPIMMVTSDCTIGIVHSGLLYCLVIAVWFISLMQLFAWQQRHLICKSMLHRSPKGLFVIDLTNGLTWKTRVCVCVCVCVCAGGW